MRLAPLPATYSEFVTSRKLKCGRKARVARLAAACVPRSPNRPVGDAGPRSEHATQHKKTFLLRAEPGAEGERGGAPQACALDRRFTPPAGSLSNPGARQILARQRNPDEGMHSVDQVPARTRAGQTTELQSSWWSKGLRPAAALAQPIVRTNNGSGTLIGQH